MPIRRDYKFTFPLQLPKSLSFLGHASRQSSSTARYFTQASSVDRLQVQTFAAAYGTCYAVLRHLCVLGGAEENLPLFTKPSKVSGNVYERIANAAHRASYQPDRGRILLAGSVEAGTWNRRPSMGVYACAKLASGWYMLVRLIAGAATLMRRYSPTSRLLPAEPRRSSRPAISIRVCPQLVEMQSLP